MSDSSERQQPRRRSEYTDDTESVLEDARQACAQARVALDAARRDTSGAATQSAALDETRKPQ